MYKNCLVPNCDNTSEKTPEKLFFHVPRNAQKRRQWYKVMKKKTKVSSCTLYCCEDHFDLESDMDNYLKYKLMGGRLKLKTGVLPHRRLGDETGETSYDNKLIREIKMEELAIKTEFEHLIDIQSVEIIKCANDEDISSEPVAGPSTVKKEFDHLIDIQPVEIIKCANDEDISLEPVTGPSAIKNEFDHLIDIEPVERIKCVNNEDITSNPVTGPTQIKKEFDHLIDIQPVEIMKRANDEDSSSEPVMGPSQIKNEFDHLIDIQPVEIIKCANNEDISSEPVTGPSVNINKLVKYIEKCDKAVQVDIKAEVSDQSTNTERWSPEIRYTARIIRRKRKLD